MFVRFFLIGTMVLIVLAVFSIQDLYLNRDFEESTKGPLEVSWTERVTKGLHDSWSRLFASSDQKERPANINKKAPFSQKVVTKIDPSFINSSLANGTQKGVASSAHLKSRKRGSSKIMSRKKNEFRTRAKHKDSQKKLKRLLNMSSGSTQIGQMERMSPGIPGRPESPIRSEYAAFSAIKAVLMGGLESSRAKQSARFYNQKPLKPTPFGDSLLGPALKKSRRVVVTGIPSRVTIRDSGRSLQLDEIEGVSDAIEQTVARLEIQKGGATYGAVLLDPKDAQFASYWGGDLSAIANREYWGQGSGKVTNPFPPIHEERANGLRFMKPKMPFISGWPPRGTVRSTRAQISKFSGKGFQMKGRGNEKMEPGKSRWTAPSSHASLRVPPQPPILAFAKGVRSSQ